jgi:hypothetical protein
VEEEVKLEAEMEEIGKAIKALEAELVALGKKLVPLEGKEEAKTLDGDDRNRLAALRDKEKQLRRKEEQLRKEKEQLRDKEKQLRKEKEQLREKELLLLRPDMLTPAFMGLSLASRVLEVSWGKPVGASNFALSSQDWQSLNVMLCLSPFGFWLPPGPLLANDGLEVRRVFGALCGCESYSQTGLEKVSETKGQCPVDGVCVDRLRMVFSASCFQCTERYRQHRMSELGCATGPASDKSKPDFTASVDGMVVFITEFKNSVTAPIEQLPQAAAMSCNAVLGQYCAGVPLEQCRCEILLTNGHLYQFAVMTLVPMCMPKLVVTSKVLDHSDHAEALQISKRLAQLVLVCSATRHRGAQRETADGSFLLDLQNYHEKPSEKWLRQDSSINCSERSYVRIFERLWVCEALRSSVVFPVGFQREGGKFRSIVFEKLDESWFIGMPKEDSLHRQFLRELCRVVTLVHSCNVVHMDLMPCNIAWKIQDGAESVCIKLLDFDCATNLPFRVGDKLQCLTLTNRREYMWSEILSPNVRFDCWYYFLYARMPRECRAFASVSGASSPAEVNGPFLEWLWHQDVNALRGDFERHHVVSQELDLDAW